MSASPSQAKRSDESGAATCSGGARTLATLGALRAILNDAAGIAVDAAGKIYPTNPVLNEETTYKADDTPTTSTIISEMDLPVGVAVDAAGKIHVLNQASFTVTTYNADGTPTTPTILAGLNDPTRIAVHRPRATCAARTAPRALDDIPPGLSRSFTPYFCGLVHFHLPRNVIE